MPSNPLDLFQKATSAIASVKEALEKSKTKTIGWEWMMNIFYMVRIRAKLIRCLEVYADYLTSEKPPEPTVIRALWENVRENAWDLDRLVRAVNRMFDDGYHMGSLKCSIEMDEVMASTSRMTEHLMKPDPMHTDTEVALIMKFTEEMRLLLECLRRIAASFDEHLLEHIGPDLGHKQSYRDYVENNLP